MITDRFSAQLLTGPPAGDVVGVARRLLAIQAQDGRGARLAIRARTEGLTAADVDRALTEDRTLVVSWLNRGTLHLVRSEDYHWLHRLTTPAIRAGNARRLGQEGVTPDEATRGVDIIERALAEEGPLSRQQLGERLDAVGIPTKGQALVHLLGLASLQGLIVRGPMMGREHAYVLVRDWLPKAPPFDRDTALAELARRYLAGHGPAGDRDLAKWCGLALGDARRALQAIASETTELAGGLVDIVRKPEAPAPDSAPAPRLLGAFDPLLMGWESRQPILGPYTSVVTKNGVFRPFALVGGRAAGTWTLQRGRVVLALFGPLTAADLAALDADGRDVVRYLAPSRGVEPPSL